MKDIDGRDRVSVPEADRCINPVFCILMTDDFGINLASVIMAMGIGSDRDTAGRGCLR
jgi:hypothetical protein